MIAEVLETASRAIVVDEMFPQAPPLLWRVLTSGELIARWLMAPTGFAAVTGTEFTFQTKPAGPWDGTINCEVVEVRVGELLSYTWRSGHSDNVGYGSELDSLVTWLLTPVATGTRLRLVHSGFVLPRNVTVFDSMSSAWPKVVRSLGEFGDSD
ncbi:MAG: ATPase [Devosia sp.]|nr:ATPase [Devosia sp.]